MKCRHFIYKKIHFTSFLRLKGILLSLAWKFAKLKLDTFVRQWATGSVDRVSSQRVVLEIRRKNIYITSIWVQISTPHTRGITEASRPPPDKGIRLRVAKFLGRIESYYFQSSETRKTQIWPYKMMTSPQNGAWQIKGTLIESGHFK